MARLVATTLRILRAHRRRVFPGFSPLGLGIALGLTCASVPFAALAQTHFPSLFNPFGAQRPAAAQFGAKRPAQARLGARRRRAPRVAATGAPYGAQPQAWSVQPQGWYGVQPQARYGVQPQVPYGVQPQASYGVQPQVPYGVQQETPSFTAPPRYARGKPWIDALAHARRQRADHEDTETPRDDGQAWCVRGCDGRYFPVTGADDKSRGETCKNLCPASQTAVVHGNTIDSAVTESGKSYSELPNAFRYRNELVAGCTCNGKDRIGLVRVEIDNDQTLRKGDIVAGADGLEVARRDADAPGGPKLSPLSRSQRALLSHLPVVEAER